MTVSHTYHRAFPQGLEGKYERVLARLRPNSSVLEIGCHTGYFSGYLANHGYTVLAIEKDQGAALQALTIGIPVICGDITNSEIVDRIRTRFDVILLMDVLEHLEDPSDVLHRLKLLLTPNGRILVTGPNVAYWAIRWQLLLGSWNYTDAGILDRTHLHFYTASTWRELIESAGYEVVSTESAEAMIPLEQRLVKYTGSRTIINFLRRIAVSLRHELFTVVYLLEARVR